MTSEVLSSRCGAVASQQSEVARDGFSGPGGLQKTASEVSRGTIVTQRCFWLPWKPLANPASEAWLWDRGEACEWVRTGLSTLGKPCCLSWVWGSGALHGDISLRGET